MCQCVCAEGALGQGEVQLAVGGLGGGKQVYLSFPESTPDQSDRLGMDSPLSGECELKWSHMKQSERVTAAADAICPRSL